MGLHLHTIISVMTNSIKKYRIMFLLYFKIAVERFYIMVGFSTKKIIFMGYKDFRGTRVISERLANLQKWKISELTCQLPSHKSKLSTFYISQLWAIISKCMRFLHDHFSRMDQNPSNCEEKIDDTMFFLKTILNVFEYALSADDN